MLPCMFLALLLMMLTLECVTARWHLRGLRDEGLSSSATNDP